VSAGWVELVMQAHKLHTPRARQAQTSAGVIAYLPQKRATNTAAMGRIAKIMFLMAFIISKLVYLSLWLFLFPDNCNYY
jgi:uncharacterized membrane protein